MKAVVVGGGIIGTWHAFELVEAGFAVDQLEAEAGPVGASVRNFGLVWVSGRRSGEELEVALQGPPALGGGRIRLSPVWASGPTARSPWPPTPPNVQVMKAFASLPDAGERAITFLEPDEVRAANPARAGPGGHRRLALRAGRRGRTAPGCRRAAGRSRASGAGALRVPPRVVEWSRWRRVPWWTRTGRAGRATSSWWRPVRPTISCPRRRTWPPHCGGCRLQMLETAPFAGTLTTSLADADSLRYYPAYEVAPLASAARPEPGGGRAPAPAPPRAAPRRRAHHRRHPCLRRALRLRAQRGPDRGAAGPSQPDPRRVRCHRCAGAGRVSTPSASTAASVCARRSSSRCGW